MSPVIMADGIGADAKAILDQFGPRQPVATYVNGPVSVWTPQEEAWFGSKIRIGVMPGQPLQANVARCLDVERFDATAVDVMPFVTARLAAGHRDATIYCNLSNLPAVLATGLDDALAAGNARLWVAWYWEQGEPESAVPLLDELARLHQIGLPTEWVWAWQFAAPGAGLPGDARWDLSAVFGVPDWSR